MKNMKKLHEKMKSIYEMMTSKDMSKDSMKDAMKRATLMYKDVQKHNYKVEEMDNDMKEMYSEMQDMSMKMMEKMKEYSDMEGYDEMEEACEACGMMKGMKEGMDKDDSDMDIDDDDMEEAKGHLSPEEKRKAKKYRKSAAGKKALKKFKKRASKAGYRPDPKRSKTAKKSAKHRRESFEVFVDTKLEKVELSKELKDTMKEFAVEMFNEASETFFVEAIKTLEDTYDEFVESVVVPDLVQDMYEDVAEYTESLVESWQDEHAKEIELSDHAKNCVEFVESMKSTWTNTLKEVPESTSIVDDYKAQLSESKETIEELESIIKQKDFKLHEHEQNKIKEKYFEGLTESQREKADKVLSECSISDMNDFTAKVKLIVSLDSKKVNEEVEKSTDKVEETIIEESVEGSKKEDERLPLWI